VVVAGWLERESSRAPAAQVYGIAVAPPAVCLVMELAARSLRAMLSDTEAYATLTWRDKLRICVECCQVRAHAIAVWR
jgi:hypothetical protein